MDNYDVFLNHRGPDVKAGFIAHLHDALKSVGLNPFLDKKSLVKGDPAFGSIDAALEVAKVHVAVVSRGYAESKYCLRELVGMLRSCKPVIPVFYNVEPAELRRVDMGQFAAAFKKHKTRETEEQVQEWADALGKLADVSGFCLSDYKGNEEELKLEVVDRLLSLTHTIEPLRSEHHMVGLKEHMDTCVNKVEKMSNTTSLLCLVGMGGIGKTSLAKEIYNHFAGYKKFQAMSFLEIDRNFLSSKEAEPNLLNKLQKKLLWDMFRVPEDNRQSYNYWFHKLSSRGPVLIVLDDIHEKSEFDKLILDTSNLTPKSCIIITSRDQHLMKVIAGTSNFNLYEVTPLGCEDSLKLFNWHAFGDEEAPKNFKVLANDVSKACNGLPLALKVVGSSLFDKRSDEDQECIWPEAIEALKGDPDVMNALNWSYTCLSISEKLMVVDIACIFCGLKKKEAIEVWKSCKKCSSCCGFGTPYTSLRRLVDKSLISIEFDFDNDHVLVMHDLLQDMGQGIGNINGSHLWEDNAVTKESNKVRALNLANSQNHKFDFKDFAKMPNLHFLILDGCDVNGNLGSISRELRWLRWRYMPMMHLPPMSNLMSNLISLDFSQSTKLANAWTKSNPALEACPNLLRLNLNDCTSITTLPDSIGRLSRLKVLSLRDCQNLQTLPRSIGQLTALQELSIWRCRSLQALPDTLTALPRLKDLNMDLCSSISKLPVTIGLMTGLISLHINLATEGQAVGIGQCNTLKYLGVTRCTDEANTVVDNLGALRNLAQLSWFNLYKCPSMTKLPDTIGLLTNLGYLGLYGCEKVKKLPNSIGQLKGLTTLELRKCSSLETLPDSVGALASLQHLHIAQCASMSQLPMAIGQLGNLLELWIHGCSGLVSLPASLRQLGELRSLQVMDCGSLEGLGVLSVLQGLRIWGCTSVTELPGSCIMVVDRDFYDPGCYHELDGWIWAQRKLKQLRVEEENDCGMLRHVCVKEHGVSRLVFWCEGYKDLWDATALDTESGQLILQRVYKCPCCKLTTAQINEELFGAHGIS